MNVHDALRAAAARAQRAPSEHNTQPWRWELRADHLELHLDPSRRLPFTDTTGHGVLLGCGCVLHHLRVALADLGFTAEVRHQPEGPDGRPLARVHAVPGPAPDAHTRALAVAMDTRRSDRRRFSGRSVPPPVMAALAEAAHPFGATLDLVVGGHRRMLIEAMAEAARLQEQQEGYAGELQRWTRRYAGGHDGIPAGARLDEPVPHYRDLELRHFPAGSLSQPRSGADERDASLLAVLCAADEEPVSVLRAGEALSAVLLEATARGVSTTPITQVLEVDTTRELVRHAVVGSHRRPMVIVRLGTPETRSTPLVPTPRRPVEDVLTDRDGW